VSKDVILELRNVARTYESGGSAGAEVLKNINLAVQRGESLAITGPSGSGKSTLLNIMGTLDCPSAGEVVLDGQNVLALAENELAALRNRKIGFIFQLHHLLPQCTVLENILVPTLVGENAAGESPEERARRLINRVGLSSRINYRPGQLSGGECQRVAVVRALINQPALLLADEPTGSLDRVAADSLTSLLAELNAEEHVTIVMVTHSMSLAKRMNRIYELCDGALIGKGQPTGTSEFRSNICRGL
jgi:ABC-type lipoprotein export system ATPase subunit